MTLAASRRTALGVAFAAVAMPRNVRAQTTPIRVVRGAVEASLGANYAAALGLFKKAGLDVDITLMNSGEAGAAAIVGGAADIGSTNVMSLAVAYRKGIDFELVAPGSEYRATAPTFAMLVAKASPLHDPKDLVGKTIAVIAINDLNTMSTQLWLEHVGIDPKSVRYVELPVPQMQAALERGTVDAVTIASPSLDLALQSGRIFALPYNAVGERFLVSGWYARRGWVAAHRDAVQRFGAAVLEAQAWANRHHAESGKLLADLTKLDPAVIARMTRTTFAERFDPSLIQPLIDLAAHNKLLAGTFPASELIDSGR
jgi:NitT/TauT family transport system substrate-binding protein